MIDWVRQTEHVSDWREVIQILDSGRALRNAWGRGEVGPSAAPERGQLEHPDLNRSSARDVLEALNAAWQYYTAPDRHDQGKRYLAGRRINVELLERLNGRVEIGHTPDSSSGLVNYLRSLGFADDMLVDAALAHRRQGIAGLTDFYRDRVLIPIRRPAGAVVGMVGRNVGVAHWPKYKNPPRTVIYDKSVDLYRPFRPPIAAGGMIIVVEGPIDALALACAAVEQRVEHRICPVTQSGKVLSAVQIRALARQHEAPLAIAFDGDKPGQDSSGRLGAQVRRLGYSSVEVALPSGADPASWLAMKGPEGIGLFLQRRTAWQLPECETPPFLTPEIPPPTCS